MFSVLLMFNRNQLGAAFGGGLLAGAVAAAVTFLSSASSESSSSTSRETSRRVDKSGGAIAKKSYKQGGKEFCYNFFKGRCNRDPCRYSHDFLDSSGEVETCRDFQKGVCDRGFFVHIIVCVSSCIKFHSRPTLQI